MCIITMKSLTHAMKAKSALEARGIECSVVSLDPGLTSRGCAYGISYPCGEGDAAQRILDGKGIPYGERIGEGRTRP